VGLAGQTARARLGENAIALVAETNEVERARERELVRRAQGGDLGAFEELYHANVRRIYALCFRMTGRADRAEEMAQDVFVRAWQKIGQFRGESRFSSWLHPMAVNLVYSDQRGRKRYTDRVTTTDDLTPYEPALPPPDPDVPMDLERALAQLPPGARRAFVLHDVEGYRHDEIAAMTGTAVGTSKAQLHRARKLLREALES
jgi:RNA polymerase sigma-70 factor (ECF subfamily)